MDMTPASVPFFESSLDGHLHAGLGFSGHGLTATKVGGKTLASLVLREEDEWSRLAGRRPADDACAAGALALAAGRRRRLGERERRPARERGRPAGPCAAASLRAFEPTCRGCIRRPPGSRRRRRNLVEAQASFRRP